MARSKGSFGLAGAVEPKAAAPLDARAVVKNMGELTAVGSFPYPYIGMETYVVSEGKKYRLIGNDPTVSANWEEVGTGGGHIIEDPEGTALTQRDILQFGGDLEVSDDDENEKTVVAPHELTVAELTEIVTPLPSVPVNMPILFDESGAEYQVGWYRLANGTKKPLYQKTWSIGLSAYSDGTDHYIMLLDVSTLGIKPIKCDGMVDKGTLSIASGFRNETRHLSIGANSIKVFLYSNMSFATTDYAIFTLQYTKTTDTPT